MVNPAAGGYPNALGLLLDAEELDSVSSAGPHIAAVSSPDAVAFIETIDAAASVSVSVSDAVAFIETIDAASVFAWQELAKSSVANATQAPANLAQVTRDEAGARTAFIIYQRGSTGTQGLVYRKSGDLGYTWDAEVQVDTKQDVFPAIVMNPVSFDIHLIYKKLGVPALAAASSAWYRVLAWTGSAWSVGGEFTNETGSTSQGFANPSIVADNDGALVAVYYRRPSTGAGRLRSSISNAPWDLTNSDEADEITMPTTGEVRPLILWTLTGAAYELLVVVEQDGTWRIYTSSEVGGDGTITLTQKQTWFAASTHEFDATWNPVSGKVGVVQNNDGAIVFREYTPATDTLAAPVTIESGAPPCYAPAITADGGDFVVVYTRQVSGNKRDLMMARSTDWAAKRQLAQDPGANAWGWVKLPRYTAGYDGLAVLWCDTADPGADGYAVYFGRLGLNIFKNVAEAFASSESLRLIIPRAEAVTFLETRVVGSELKSAADAFTLTEVSLNVIRLVLETVRLTEALGGARGLAETVAFTDALDPLRPALAAEAWSFAESLGFVHQITLDDAAALDEVAAVNAHLADIATLVEDVTGLRMAVLEEPAFTEDLVVQFLVTDVQTVDDQVKVDQAVIDALTLDEVLNMVKEALEAGTVEDDLLLNGAVVDSVTATDIILQLSVAAPDSWALSEVLSKVASVRLAVRLHMAKGAVTLRMEGPDTTGEPWG